MAVKRIFLTVGAAFIIYAASGMIYCIDRNYAEVGLKCLALCPLEIIIGIVGTVLVFACRKGAQGYFSDWIFWTVRD